MEPIINLDDPIGKTVGRRTKIRDPLAYVNGLQQSMGELAPLRIPRGVYRFETFEEADQWLMDHLIRKPVN